MNRSDDLDILIKKAIQDELANTPSPALTPSQAWEQLSRKLDEAKKAHLRQQRLFRRRKFFYAVSVAVILFLAVLWHSPNSAALGKLTEIIHLVQGDFIHLLIRVDAPYEDENPPPDFYYGVVGQDVSTYETTDLSKLRNYISFDPRLPKYIPKDLRFQSASIMKDKSNGFEEIYFFYLGKNHRRVTIIERVVVTSLGSGLVANREDARLKKVTVNGQPASLITYNESIRELVWVEASYYYFSIYGELSEEEIIAIAESM